MFRQLLTMFGLLSLLTLQVEGEQKPSAPPEPTPPPDKPKTFTQEDVNDLLAAERKAERERVERKLKDEQDERDRKAKEERDRDEAEKRGDFDKVKNDLASKLQLAEGERDTYKGRLEEAMDLIRADVDAAWKSIPAEVAEMYEGDGDDVLAKKKHLTRSAKLIDRLSKTSARGNGPDPKGAGNRELEPTESLIPRKRLI